MSTKRLFGKRTSIHAGRMKGNRKASYWIAFQEFESADERPAPGCPPKESVVCLDLTSDQLLGLRELIDDLLHAPVTSSYQDDDIIEKAICAYGRWVTQTGRRLTQPCRASSEVHGNTVVLRNANGYLARYNIDRHKGTLTGPLLSEKKSEN